MSNTIVIFGASGDLTRRKLIPALYELFRKDRLGGANPLKLRLIMGATGRGSAISKGPVSDGKTLARSDARVIAVLTPTPLGAPVQGPAELSRGAGNSNLAIWPFNAGPETGTCRLTFWNSETFRGKAPNNMGAHAHAQHKGLRSRITMVNLAILEMTLFLPGYQSTGARVPQACF